MAPYTLVMGGAYPYMDLNAKYEKLYYDVIYNTDGAICIIEYATEIKQATKK
jgi:hypothetical protein